MRIFPILIVGIFVLSSLAIANTITDMGSKENPYKDRESAEEALDSVNNNFIVPDISCSHSKQWTCNLNNLENEECSINFICSANNQDFSDEISISYDETKDFNFTFYENQFKASIISILNITEKEDYYYVEKV